MTDQTKTLDPADYEAWASGELVIGTDGHVVPPPGEAAVDMRVTGERDQ